MFWTAAITVAAVAVIGVPFTYYWFRFSDRWAKEDQKRFNAPDRSADDRPEIRVITAPRRDND